MTIQLRSLSDVAADLKAASEEMARAWNHQMDCDIARTQATSAMMQAQRRVDELQRELVQTATGQANHDALARIVRGERA